MEENTPGRSLGGRFTEATDPLLERVNRSVETDKRMWAEDLAGSRAHAQMLADVGLLTEGESRAILEGLDAVGAEFERGEFTFLPADEDIHMAVERRLTELVGGPARKLHTGRSRNDQVMTDALLWLRGALERLTGELKTYGWALVQKAENGAHTPMPSFTHLQPAQVSSVGQWLLSHAWEVERHLRRVQDLYKRLDECPLGSGASVGTYLPVDRKQTAQTLGFARPIPNAMAATGSRTDLLDALGVLALIGTTLSRLGEEIVVFCSPGFDYLTLPDRLTTGSSLLPQKRNPDGAELLRGSGKLAAVDFSGLASAVSGLVSGYSKDLQFDKELLFRTFDRIVDLLGLATRHIDALGWNADKMAAHCTPALAALWLADQLVLAGLPFRTAHHVVGLAVRLGGDDGLLAGLTQIAEQNPEELPGDPRSWPLKLAGMTPDALLRDLATEGSASPESVLRQAEWFRSRMA